MGKEKKEKKEKKVKEEEPMEVEEPKKKEKKEKKRKLEEAEVAPAKKEKKKKKDKEAEAPVEETKKEKKKKKGKEEAEEPTKKKKKKKEASSDSESEKEAAAKEDSDEEEPVMKIKNQETKKAEAIAAVTSTKVFMGNLSFKIDDDSFKAAVEPTCGKVVSIKWMEDRETGKFRGSGIIEFESTEAAGKAVLMEGTDILDRPVRCRIWEERSTPGKPKREPRALSERPDNCTTVFCGNLSYDIDDDKMTAFFKECGEVKQIRWLTDRESGEFKGCGFVEFYDSDSVDKAVKLNGEDCLGRGIRLDYSAPKPRD